MNVREGQRFAFEVFLKPVCCFEEGREERAILVVWSVQISAIWTNTFCNLDKYILQFGQIYFVIQTNTFIIYAFSRLPDTAKDMQLFLVQTTNWENFLLFTPEKSENVHITMKPRTGKTIMM